MGEDDGNLLKMRFYKNINATGPQKYFWLIHLFIYLLRRHDNLTRNNVVQITHEGLWFNPNQ